MTYTLKVLPRMTNPQLLIDVLIELADIILTNVWDYDLSVGWTSALVMDRLNDIISVVINQNPAYHDFTGAIFDEPARMDILKVIDFLVEYRTTLTGDILPYWQPVWKEGVVGSPQYLMTGSWWTRSRLIQVVWEYDSVEAVERALFVTSQTEADVVELRTGRVIKKLI